MRCTREDVVLITIKKKITSNGEIKRSAKKRRAPASAKSHRTRGVIKMKLTLKKNMLNCGARIMLNVVVMNC